MYTQISKNPKVIITGKLMSQQRKKMDDNKNPNEMLILNFSFEEKFKKLIA